MVSERTDAQWEAIRPWLPPRRGRPRADERRTLHGIGYVLRSGCCWGDRPRRSDAGRRRWPQAGVWARIGRGRGMEVGGRD